MNALLESALWTGGLLTTISGLMYVLTVIDPRTDRGHTVGPSAALGPSPDEVAQPALAGRAARS